MWSFKLATRYLNERRPAIIFSRVISEFVNFARYSRTSVARTGSEPLSMFETGVIRSNEC